MKNDTKESRAIEVAETRSRAMVLKRGAIVAVIRKRSPSDKGPKRTADAMADQLRSRGYIEVG